MTLQFRSRTIKSQFSLTLEPWSKDSIQLKSNKASTRNPHFCPCQIWKRGLLHFYQMLKSRSQLLPTLFSSMTSSILSTGCRNIKEFHLSFRSHSWASSHSLRLFLHSSTAMKPRNRKVHSHRWETMMRQKSKLSKKHLRSWIWIESFEKNWIKN